MDRPLIRTQPAAGAHCFSRYGRLAVLLLLGMLPLLMSACNTLPRGNAADGERWFKLNRCNGCHGEGGTGGKGPVLAATGLPFHRFLAKLREPKSAIMPTFEPERLSDNDAADIYLWLLSRK